MEKEHRAMLSIERHRVTSIVDYAYFDYNFLNTEISDDRVHDDEEITGDHFTWA